MAGYLDLQRSFSCSLSNYSDGSGIKGRGIRLDCCSVHSWGCTCLCSCDLGDWRFSLCPLQTQLCGSSGLGCWPYGFGGDGLWLWACWTCEVLWKVHHFSRWTLLARICPHFLCIHSSWNVTYGSSQRAHVGRSVPDLPAIRQVIRQVTRQFIRQTFSLCRAQCVWFRGCPGCCGCCCWIIHMKQRAAQHLSVLHSSCPFLSHLRQSRHTTQAHHVPGTDQCYSMFIFVYFQVWLKSISLQPIRLW